jgi:hypothetical protein
MKEKKNNVELLAQAEVMQDLELVPLSEWNKHYKFPSVGALRQLVFYNKAGFNKVVRKISGRLYIKVSDFNKWVDENCTVA